MNFENAIFTSRTLRPNCSLTFCVILSKPTCRRILIKPRQVRINHLINVAKNISHAWNRASARKRIRTSERNKIQVLIELAND